MHSKKSGVFQHLAWLEIDFIYPLLRVPFVCVLRLHKLERIIRLLISVRVLLMSETLQGCIRLPLLQPRKISLII
jgi:hypothetical protein